MSEKPLNTGSTMETSISSIQDFQTSLSHGISSISSSPANTILPSLEEGTRTMTQLSSDLPITLMNSQYEMHLPFTFPSSSSTVAGIASDSFTEQVRPTFSPHGATIISVNEMSMIDSTMATEKTHTAKSQTEFLTASSGKTTNTASTSFERLDR